MTANIYLYAYIFLGLIWVFANSKREEDGNKKKKVRESAMLRNLESLGLTKPTKNEIRENSGMVEASEDK